jgi:hypothetical protein
MTRLLASLLVCWLAVTPAAAASQPAKEDGVTGLLRKVEDALQSGDVSAYLGLLSSTAVRERARIFAETVMGDGATRAVIREEDRTQLFGTLPGDGYRLLLEVFAERGSDARLSSWQLDVRRLRDAQADAAPPDEWVISDQELLSTLSGLRHLSLSARRQFTARNYVVTSEDFKLTLTDGVVFTEETSGDPTALVLLGRGEMVFSPPLETERGQVRIFAGADIVDTPFDAALVRAGSFDLSAALADGTLTERPVDPRDFRRADDVFKTEVVKSFALDLGDLTNDTWSLAPSYGDLLAEVRTRRFDTLTYTKSHNEAEDISLFDRRRQRNISVYASEARRAAAGSSYDSAATADYYATDYDVQATFSPERAFIEGRTRLNLHVQAPSMGSLTLRLAEPLVVQSVVAEGFGRLLSFRVRNQNSLLVNLPNAVSKGVELTLVVSYAGRLLPLPTDREAISLEPGQEPQQDDSMAVPTEPAYLYSNRSYWYAQASFEHYATASLRLTVPPGYRCVASGVLKSVEPVAAGDADKTPVRQRPQLFTFAAGQPVRYLSCLIARLTTVRTHTVRLGEPVSGRPAERPAGVFYDTLELSMLAHARQQGRARQLADRAADILRFYSSITGDFPYPSLSIAVIESELPGGHSPAYMTVLNQPVPGSRRVWRGDPASFDDYPEYFLAHELAHQWWGQAVGWKNYHEQWLSEGLAQYFAALYAERVRGRAVYEGVLSRMRRFAQEDSDQGPVYLGYRVGHLKNDSRPFRAVVYDKGAIVLHTLRRLIGDDAFFRGLRRYYLAWRFRRAGTPDLQHAFETEAGISLRRFFQRWIYGATIPQVKVTTQLDNGGQESEVIVRFEQVGEVFDVPVTVTVDCVGRPTMDIPVQLTNQVTEVRIPLRGTLRKIDVNRDELTIGEFIRQLP